MKPSTTITTKIYLFGRHQFRSITESAVPFDNGTFELVMGGNEENSTKNTHVLNANDARRLYEILEEEFGFKAEEG